MNDNIAPIRPEISVQDLLDAVQAKEIAPGVTLCTKDGYVTGNAIVIKEIKPTTTMADWLEANNQKLWLIETDFGNRCQFTDAEIEAYYNLGYQRDHDSWWEARLALIQKNVEESRDGTV